MELLLIAWHGEWKNPKQRERERERGTFKLKKFHPLNNSIHSLCDKLWKKLKHNYSITVTVSLIFDSRKSWIARPLLVRCNRHSWSSVCWLNCEEKTLFSSVLSSSSLLLLLSLIMSWVIDWGRRKTIEWKDCNWDGIIWWNLITDSVGLLHFTRYFPFFLAVIDEDKLNEVANCFSPANASSATSETEWEEKELIRGMGFVTSDKALAKNMIYIRKQIWPAARLVTRWRGWCLRTFTARSSHLVGWLRENGC